MYCTSAVTHLDLDSELKWCLRGRHQQVRRQFIVTNDDGSEEVEQDDCSSHQTSVSQPALSMPPPATPSVRPPYGVPSSSVDTPASSSVPRSSATASTASVRRPNPSERARALQIANLQRDELPIPDYTPEALRQPALHDEDEQLRADFHAALDRINFVTCGRCQEHWDHNLDRESVCNRCRRADKNKSEEEPHLWSVDNNTNPHDWPTYVDEDGVTQPLPDLTPVEEQLIARVHCFVELRQIKGAAFKYRGNIISFLRDTAKVYNTLPRLPEDCDNVILRPASSTDPNIKKVFTKDFRVRRHSVSVWLRHLVANHSGYSDVVISEERLSQLPVDDNVIEQFIVEEEGEAQDLAASIPGFSSDAATRPEAETVMRSSPPPLEPTDEDEEDEEDDDDDQSEEPYRAAVPDFLMRETELDNIRRALGMRHSQAERMDEIHTDPLSRPPPASIPMNLFSEPVRPSQQGDNPPRTVQPLPLSSELPDQELNWDPLTRPAPPDASAPHLSMPELQHTPINEFNRQEKIWSRAFPTLFPYGECDPNEARSRTVSLEQMTAHLLRHRSGRFAAHPRWLYVAFNQKMRASTNKKASFMVHKDAQLGDLTLEQLKAILSADESPEAKAILSSVSRYSGALAGTRYYWNGKRKQVQSMVHALRQPSLFQTFSAADHHWDSLQRLFATYPEWQEATDARRRVIARDNLRTKPHVAAYHIYERYQLFFRLVVKPKFGIQDFWSRAEFQTRGSAHYHNLYWMERDDSSNTPPIIQDAENEAQRLAFAEFWGLHIKAENPDPTRQSAPVGERSTLSAMPSELKNNLEQLSITANRVQRHACNHAYCLRQNLRTKQTECRFYFPRPAHEAPILTKDLNPTYYMYDPARKEDVTNMNGYNRLLLMGWLANTDTTPVTDARAALNYISKYASKDEKRSVTFKEISAKILPKVSSNRPAVSYIAKVMNQLIAERDWSGQEICHILLGLPLVTSSRTTLAVDSRKPEHQGAFVRIGDDSVQTGLSTLQKYMQRRSHMTDDQYAANGNVSFFCFATGYEMLRKGKWGPRPQASDRVLQYFPVYSHEMESDQREDYCRVKIILHHPFETYPQLPYAFPASPTTTYDSWSAAYEHCSQNHQHERDYYGVTLGPDLEETHDDQGEEEPTDEQTWELLAAQLPGRAVAEDILAEILGKREIDRTYDWSSHVGGPVVEADWWKYQKPEGPLDLRVEDNPESPFDPRVLEPEQRLIFENVTIKIHNQLTGAENPLTQDIIEVDGKAGSGKSYLIKGLSIALQNIADKLDWGNPVIRLAPTGIAAHSIQGRTLHSALRLPLRTADYEPLKPADLQGLQAAWKSVLVLIIDEKSMLSQSLLHWIDQRLRQIRPEYSSLIFGGITVLLFGDFWQLPPVKGLPLFTSHTRSNKPPKASDIAGRLAYTQFNNVVELVTLKRQQAGDSEFVDALQALRTASIERSHWKTLSSRVRMNLTATQRRLFKDAIRIYGRKTEVNAFNQEGPLALKQPAKLVRAAHTGKDAHSATFDNAGSLHAVIPICLGARVMITQNLWVEQGVVNGSLGTVRAITWADGLDTSNDPPSAIFLELDGYTGPIFENTTWVPILPVKRDYIQNKEACTRTQFPLSIAHAITIHKAQGMTMDKAVLNIAKPDFAAGLSYVAVSRVRRLEDLMFEEAFDLERFKSKPSEVSIQRQTDYDRRQQLLVPLPDWSEDDVVWMPSPRRPLLQHDPRTVAEEEDVVMQGAETAGLAVDVPIAISSDDESSEAGDNANNSFDDMYDATPPPA